MKFSVIDLNTGVQPHLPEDYEFLLHDDGSVSVVSDTDHDSYCLPTPYAVDFAFHKDGNSEWIWSHSVVHD